MGKLYVIGIGPGGLEHMTLKAKQAIEESNIVVGYNKYIDMIKPLVEDKELFSTGMRGEEARCRKALELSKENNTVALISTGDSGIYGMAGLILQMQNDEEVEVIPGVTASSNRISGGRKSLTVGSSGPLSAANSAPVPTASTISRLLLSLSAVSLAQRLRRM